MARKKWILLSVVVVFVGLGLAVAPVVVSKVVKSGVEAEFDKSARGVRVGKARVGIFGSGVLLSEVSGAADSRTVPRYLQIEEVRLDMSWWELREPVIHIRRVVISRPSLIVEKGDMGLNLDKIRATVRRPGTVIEQESRVIIDEVAVEDGTVTILKSVPGMSQDETVLVSGLVVRDIGKRWPGGSLISYALDDVVRAMAAEAVKSEGVSGEAREYVTRPMLVEFPSSQPSGR